MAEPDQSFNEEEVDQQQEDLQPEQVEELAEEPEEEHEDAPVATVATGGERWPGWPGESVFRILVPAQKVGSIIGRKGEYIKKMCEETKARIKILDGPPGITERAVMISAKEEPESSLPPAIDGLLRVHKRVVDGLDDDSSQTALSGVKVSTRLLVPAPQAGNLIGKQGATVKSIQEASNCIVRVIEDLPVFAFQDDRIVEVLGEPAAAHKALELIASHLRKFLVDRSIIPILETQMQKPVTHMEYAPPSQSWGPPPQPFPPSVAGPPPYRMNPPFYGGAPPRQHENYYPPAEMPPHLEKQPYQGMPVYNREAPLPMQSSASNPAVQSLITQLTQQMVIPLSFADAVIGTDGASISFIRRVSGATVTIQENREVPGEMTAEISGSASQVQTAQQLIQKCIAEAAAAQSQAAATTDQGYGHGAYANQNNMYPTAPPNAGVGGQTGAYGSVYGGNYGY